MTSTKAIRNMSGKAQDHYREVAGIDARDAAGLIGLARPVLDATGERTIVGIYKAAEAGIEDDEDAGRYATVCEIHSSCIIHPTRALAFDHAQDPAGWCEDCRA
jgi:hypothetical protein